MEGQKAMTTTTDLPPWLVEAAQLLAAAAGVAEIRGRYLDAFRSQLVTAGQSGPALDDRCRSMLRDCQAHNDRLVSQGLRRQSLRTLLDDGKWREAPAAETKPQDLPMSTQRGAALPVPPEFADAWDRERQRNTEAAAKRREQREAEEHKQAQERAAHAERIRQAELELAENPKLNDLLQRRWHGKWDGANEAALAKLRDSRREAAPRRWRR